MNIFVIMILCLTNNAYSVIRKNPKINEFKPRAITKQDFSVQGKKINPQQKPSSTNKSQTRINSNNDEEEQLSVKKQIEITTPKPKTFGEAIAQSSKKMQEQSNKIQQENNYRLIFNEDRSSQNSRARISISSNEIKSPAKIASKSTDRDFANSTKNSDDRSILTTKNMLPNHPTNIEARLSSSQSLASSILEN